MPRSGDFSVISLMMVATMSENIHPLLKSLWDLENELRSASQRDFYA